MILLILLLQLSFEVSSIDSATTVGGNETDHLALLEFKAKIVFDPQNATSSWNASTNFCNWEGVVCGRKHKRVTILDLGSKGLVGSLSPYIGNMSFLRRILLENNTIQGEIPSELGHLFRLRILDLRNNSFEGKIPSNLSKCLNIIALGLSSNKLVGNIPAELVALSRLEIILIHYNHLTGGIPPFLGNLSLLEDISAADNFFSGNIPYSLGQLKHLSFLGLGGNNLSGIVPQSLYNISSITTLSMPYNSLHGSLPSDIGHLLPQLERLQMSFNNFSGSIPASLSNASKLQELHLNSNTFNGKVNLDFRGLQKLVRLFLSNNNLGNKGDDVLDFIPSLLNCSNLKSVDIPYNQFKGDLPDFVGNISSSIEQLSLQVNQISGSLPHWLSRLVNLQALDLSYNQITGTIPIEFGKLPRLEWLLLNDNRLLDPIPSSLGNISSLSLINLSRNNLRGIIPSALGNCRRLLFLYLSENNLSGSMSEKIFPMRSMLVEVALHRNHLDGPLPTEIGNLFKLNTFSISQNKLSGKIPSALSQCSSLEFLYMDNNNFQDSKILGEIALEYVNLSFNNFDGEVPIRGVFANASAISVTRNNRLCGGIPDLQLPTCFVETSKRSKMHNVKIVVIIIPCVFGVTVISTAIYYMFKKKKRDKSPTSLQAKSLQRVSYKMLLKATDGFSSANLIGVGSFGSVYKGTSVEDGTTFAVKVVNLQQQGASKSFMAECKALRNARHRNLVKIITSCSSIDFQGNDFKALVYDYMPNGNLNKWLHTNVTHEQPSLSLLQRLSIAIDVGNGLDYLHHHCEKLIVHCDLKPSNILLDNDMVAHLGDFGISKFLPHFMNPTQSSSIGVRGTIGYAAPEYGLGSEVSTGGDVYSYGILLLEMVTRKKPTDDIFVEGLNLHNFARMALANQVLEIVDPILLQENDEGVMSNSKVECLISMIKVGVACSMESPQDRIDISDAIKELHSIRNNFMLARRKPSMHQTGT